MGLWKVLPGQGGSQMRLWEAQEPESPRSQASAQPRQVGLLWALCFLFHGLGEQVAGLQSFGAK